MNSPKVKAAIEATYQKLASMPTWKFKLLLLKHRLFPSFWGRVFNRLTKDGMWPPREDE